jgi:hypothetical protein
VLAKVCVAMTLLMSAQVDAWLPDIEITTVLVQKSTVRYPVGSNTVPFLELLIDESEFRGFEQRLLDSVTSNLRVCGTCGVASYGLERAVQTPGQSETVRGAWTGRPMIDANAVVLTHNPTLLPYVMTPKKEQAFACGRCSRKPIELYASRHLPELPGQYGNMLAALPFEALHRLSCLDLTFGIRANKYGYMSGTFGNTSVVGAPFLQMAQGSLLPATWWLPTCLQSCTGVHPATVTTIMLASA